MTGTLTYSTLPVEIKKIANESLGLGFLKSLFNYSNTYHLMIKISDGVFIGFSLYHFEEREVAGVLNVTGVIDCVYVSAAYRQEGFGTLLTFSTLKKMAAYGADRVELTMKTPGLDNRDGEPGVPLVGSEELLRHLGFSPVKVFKDHYAAKAKKYGYDCNFCNTRPDACLGMLYAIQSRSE